MGQDPILPNGVDRVERRVDAAEDELVLMRELRSALLRAGLTPADWARRVSETTGRRIEARKISGYVYGWPSRKEMGGFKWEDFIAMLLEPSLQIEPERANALLILAVRTKWVGGLNRSEDADVYLISPNEWLSSRRRYEKPGSSRADAVPERRLFGRDAALVELDHLRSRRLRNNLPTYLTTFVGRASERALLLGELERSHVVTLWGSPGCGKSRLAFEVANELKDRFPDGTWWIDLPSDSDNSFISTLAATVRISLPPEQPDAVDALVQALRPQRVLLILDNAERQLHAVRDVLKAVSGACPEVRSVVTTRRPLDLEGERIVALDPLPLPERDSDLLDSDSVRLFVDRMGLRRNENLAVHDHLALARICRQLAGIPLAIEIVAPHASRMTLGRLEQTLGEHLLQLRHPSGQRDPRHETLQAAISWSVDDLPETTQHLFVASSVFAGSSSVTALAAVSGLATKIAETEVQRLIDMALAFPQADPNGALRIRLLEPLREYAQQRLPDEELLYLRRRHADYFAEWVRALDLPFSEPEPVDLHSRIEREHENLRRALATFVEAGDTAKAHALARRIWLDWHHAGMSDETLSWLSRVLEMGSPASIEDRVLVLRGAGVVARSRGNFELSHRLLSEALDMSKATGDWTLVAPTLEQLANTFSAAGDQKQALGQFAELRRIYEEKGDERGIALARVSIGTVLGLQGDYAGASTELSAALPILESDAANRAVAMLNLGEVKLAEGHTDEAGLYLQRARDRYQAVGIARGRAYCDLLLAAVARLEEDPDRAGNLARTAIESFVAIAYPQGVARSLEELAAQAVEVGAPKRALVLAALAESEVARPRDRQPPALTERYHKLLDPIRERLGPEESDRWKQYALTLSDQEMVKLALAETNDEIAR